MPHHFCWFQSFIKGRRNNPGWPRYLDWKKSHQQQWPQNDQWESSEWHSSDEAERARLVDTKVLSEFWMNHEPWAWFKVMTQNPSGESSSCKVSSLAGFEWPTVIARTNIMSKSWKSYTRTLKSHSRVQNQDVKHENVQAKHLISASSKKEIPQIMPHPRKLGRIAILEGKMLFL